jgi:phenylacetaldehyde dehydrogenase
VFDQIVAGLSSEAAKLQIGHGLDPATTLGPLVSDEQYQKVQGYLDSGRSEGAEVVTGGGVHGNRGYFIQPTVLANTNRDMKVVREEIFGPMICVQPFEEDDLDGIAKFDNDTEYGLSASIWTQDLTKAHTLARKIRAGTVWVNTHNWGDAALPFGGYKQSGWGREMGKEVMENYTETKAVGVRLV